MKCPECGKQRRPADTFCPYCSAKYDTSAKEEIHREIREIGNPSAGKVIDYLTEPTEMTTSGCLGSLTGIFVVGVVGYTVFALVLLFLIFVMMWGFP